jgi:phosphatidylserine synthase
MIAAKQVADILTWARTLLAVALPVLGITQGAKSLQLAVILLIANWTADSLDGVLARRSSVQYHTWIGDHDLEIDMLISVGALAYLVTAGFLSWQAAAVYVLVWLLIFWRFGIPHVVGVLFQIPIYLYFIGKATIEIPQVAIWIVVWIVAAIIVTWPKFPKVILPEFFGDVRDLFSGKKQDPE